VVITDPKSEIYTDTAAMLRENGYNVRVFNLVNPVYSDSWNCMADLKGDTLMSQVLTDVVISNTNHDSKGDHFWDNGEGNLLKSLVLYVDSDVTRGLDTKNLPAVYQLLTNHTERQLSVMFDKLPLHHPARAPYNLFRQASDTVRAGIILGLGTRLQVLQNEAVKKIISSSDIDLSEPGKTKCAYFIILSDQESSLDFLSSLFFSFLFIKLVRYADTRPDGKCDVPVNIVLEEVSNIGTIPDFARKLSTIRSRALQVCMTLQSLSQIQNRYPNNLWAELLGNCDTQLMLGCTDEISANFFSLRSGDMTVDINSTMTMRKTIAIAQVIPEYRSMDGQGRRRLMTPDEIMRLPNNELLIIIRGQKMLKAQKIDYTELPYARKIKQESIYEYQPQQDVHQEIQQEEPDTQTETETEEPVQPAAVKKSNNTLYSNAKPPDDF